MDAFESIVSRILEKDGYWVRKSVKVACTPAEKASFGPKSSPTPELDLVAFNGRTLILYEVKSFLDSDGVRLAGVNGTDPDDGKKYKIINNPIYQDLMSSKVIHEFGIPTDSRVLYGLAAGNIYPPDLNGIIQFFQGNASLKLLTPDYLADALLKLFGTVYINDEVTMTIKLLGNQNKLVL